MVTKEDIERLQENLKAAIMRDDWAMCDLLVKQISEASEQLRQPTQRALDLPNEPLCICGKPLKDHQGVVCLPESASQ